ncbi:MAG: DNA-binding protein WhiA [Thermoleophilia bacterium]|nr:DNA-binding protein WhiA [Thermoleophilia bacterium]
MSSGFTRAFREELAKVDDKQPCCRMAAVAGLVHTAGTFLIHGGADDDGRYEVRLATTVQAAAKMAYSQFKAFGAEGDLLTRREPRLQQRLVYEVHVMGSPAALQALNEMGVLSDSFELQSGVSRRLVKKGCCRSAFVRGCLIGAGSANAPQKEAHLEIVTPHQGFSDDLVRLLQEMDFHPGVRTRRGSYVVYLKGRDEVAGLLALAGAHVAALQVEEQSVVKEVRSRANRAANCDAANLRRTSTAASRQLEAIDSLLRTGRLATLPPALREMAELRSLHPYLNLAELAEAGGEGLTRSAVNHRLRRLVEVGERAGGKSPHGRIQYPRPARTKR